MTEAPATRGLFDLGGKVALVTGAGRGLGRAIAEGFAAFGAHVVRAERNEGWAKDTAAALAVDVAEPASISAMAGALAAAPGRGDVLVKNAGIATTPVRVHEMAVEDWDRLMAVNLRSVFLCTRAVIPMMLTQGAAPSSTSRPFLGSSASSRRSGAPAPTTPPPRRARSASRGRWRSTTRGKGIRVNAIAPGWHGGTRLGEERRAAASPETRARFDRVVVGRTPLGRKGRPEELRGLAVYLASDASTFVTGQVFVHDGGWVAA